MPLSHHRHDPRWRELRGCQWPSSRPMSTPLLWACNPGEHPLMLALLHLPSTRLLHSDFTSLSERPYAKSSGRGGSRRRRQQREVRRFARHTKVAGLVVADQRSQQSPQRSTGAQRHERARDLIVVSSARPSGPWLACTSLGNGPFRHVPIALVTLGGGLCPP